MKHSTFIREWIEYTKFEIGISLNPFNFFQGKTIHCFGQIFAGMEQIN